MVKYPGENEKIIDLGGGYRDAFSKILEELMDTNIEGKVGDKVKCLKKPVIPGVQETFILNEDATSEPDRELFVCLGGFLAFAFLSG